MSSTTTNLGLVKMASGETIGQWSDANNGSGANLDKIDTAIGNLNSQITGNLTYRYDYETTSSVTIPANSFETLVALGNAGLPAGADVICASIETYNQTNTDSLIVTKTKWYSTRYLKAFNPTSSNIEVPSGTIITIYYRL